MYWMKVSRTMGINLDQIVYWNDAPEREVLFLHTMESTRTIELRGTERRVALAILEHVLAPPY